MGSGGWDDKFTVQWCEGDRKEEVLQFLRTADFAIDDLRIIKKNFTPDMLPAGMPAGLRKEMEEGFTGKTLERVLVSHKSKHGQAIELPLHEESDGTQKIFNLAAQWIDTFDNGHVIVFDELHEHLHPKLVRYLVDRFHDPAANANGAQLVFSTHDTSILSQEVFRRDQIWFCERNSQQETSLFPLTDFRLWRGVDNLARSYLGGRYGALPALRSPSTMTVD